MVRPRLRDGAPPSVLPKEFSNVWVSPFRRAIDGRPTVCIYGIDVGLPLEKEFHDFEIAVLSGHVEWGKPIRRHGIHVCPLVEEKRHHFRMILLDRVVKQRGTLPFPCDEYTSVSLDGSLYPLQIPRRRRGEDRRVILRPMVRGREKTAADLKGQG